MPTLIYLGAREEEASKEYKIETYKREKKKLIASFQRLKMRLHDVKEF